MLSARAAAITSAMLLLFVGCQRHSDQPGLPAQKTARQLAPEQQTTESAVPETVQQSTSQSTAQSTAPDDARWSVRTGETDNFSHVASGTPVIQCGSLQYFQGNPELFAHSFRYTESEPDAVTLTRVGEVNGFAIYTVIHRIQSTVDGRPYPSHIKMILVERKPGEFCAIYNDNSDEGAFMSVESAYLVKVDSQDILVTRDTVKGNCGCYAEAYWSFDKDGPFFLDLGVIGDTVEKLVFQGTIGRGANFDIQTLSFKTRIAEPGDAMCCSTGGSVALKFAIRNHQLEVVSQEYDPPLFDPDN
jgi:hypothetical protein